MKVREQAHEPHDVLCVSPASEPERIDAAYHSLIRKHGGRYDDVDRVRTIEAAYDQLKGPQRGHGHSAATAEQEATVDAPPSPPRPGAPGGCARLSPQLWRVRPRGKLLNSTPAPAPLAKGAVPQALPSSPPPVLPPEPSFSHDPASAESDRSPARHWTISDWSSDEYPESASEKAEPTDQPSENPIAVVGIDRPRFATPLAAGLAVITAALVTQYLIDQSPRSDKNEVRSGTAAFAPRPTVPPQAHAARQQQGRSDDLHTRFVEARQQPVPAPAAVEVAASAKDLDQAATATAIAQSEASLTTTEPAAPAPVSSPPLNLTPAIPALPTAASKQASQEPLAPSPPQSQVAKPQAAVTMPARWISGGLQDSDNRYGRFMGAVAVRILVRPNGRAGGCRIARSSGNPALDQTTCRLLGERLLFSPAKNAAGRPIESEVGTTYVWGRRVRR